MTLAPWEYLFFAFNAFNFPDLFWPTVYASIAALVATVVPEAERRSGGPETTTESS